MLALAALVLAAVPVDAAQAGSGAIDPRTVQSATIYELNVDAAMCPSIVLKTGALCPTAGRHFLLKQNEIARVLSLVNEHTSWDAARKPKCAVPREAVVVETTSGRRTFDINLECDFVAGKAPTKATRLALSQFLRGFGFVAHVPIIVE
jgi:hypothetical protein